METIENLCQDRLLDRKWLIAPSLQTGASWLEHVVRQGVPCVNTTPITIQRLAFEFAGTALTKQGLTVLNPSMAALIVQSAWETLPADGYFQSLKPTLGLYRAVASAIEELRMQGTKPADLAAIQASAASIRKAADLAVLLSNWARYLDQHKLADRAIVLELAIGFAASQRIPSTDLVLLPTECDTSGLERQLLEAIPKDQLFEMECPLEFVSDGYESGFDAFFFRAIGEVNEVREVFRHCCEQSIPLDCVEILHTDARTYVPLVHEIASLVDHPEGKLPITFAEGLPVRPAQPIRALEALLRWAEADFPLQPIVEMFNDVLLDCGELSGPALARMLRPLAIKTGKENYAPRLQQQQEGVKAALANTPIGSEEEGEARRVRLQRKAEGLQFLQQTIGELVELASVMQSGHTTAAIEAADTFLAKHARSANEFDAVATKRIRQEITDQRRWCEILNIELQVADWLRCIIHDTSISESGPKPGCLHVASLANGGQSGRTVTFVVGMDDRRFPGALLQDPILLDAERETLSEDFPTSFRKQLQTIRAIQQTLGRIRGSLSVSWACVNIADGSDVFPASLAHKLGQIVYDGEDEWDSNCLNRMAGSPVSFSAATMEAAFSESDQFVGLLSRSQTNRIAAVHRTFPNLVDGAQAQRNRLTQFGEYSGRISLAKDLPTPFKHDGPVYSASALETLGRCPLAFFFSRRLNIYPLDTVDENLDRWLDAAQFGSLLHELFRRFMASLATGEPPEFDKHWASLRTHLKAIVEEARSEIPPPNENSFRKDLTQLLRIARTFLREEEQNCQGGRIQPLFFEASLGMLRVDRANGTKLDTAEPVFVQLGQGRSIRAKGQIDRVDQRTDRLYSVTDYKTGGAFGYSSTQPFGGGRRVQNVLYMKMVQSVLREKISDDARVARFEYFFPGTRANGLRLGWSALDLEPGVHLLNTLCSLDAAGIYPPTSDPNDCTFCDFQSVCGNYKQVTKASKDWLYREADLADWKDVRHG